MLEAGAGPEKTRQPARTAPNSQAAIRRRLLTRFLCSRAAQPRPHEPGPLVQMLAGALAGGVARVFVAPLDVVKIRMQARGDPLHHFDFSIF